VKDSIGSVARNFSRQLAEQGWNEDTSWAGSGTAGSTWSRKLQGGATVRGTLMLMAFEGDRFTAAFRATVTK
jgi:hypothetical protein